MSDLEKAIRYFCLFDAYDDKDAMAERYLAISNLVKNDDSEEVLQYAKKYEKMLDLLNG